MGIDHTNEEVNNVPWSPNTASFDPYDLRKSRYMKRVAAQIHNAGHISQQNISHAQSMKHVAAPVRRPNNPLHDKYTCMSNTLLATQSHPYLRNGAAPKNYNTIQRRPSTVLIPKSVGLDVRDTNQATNSTDTWKSRNPPTIEEQINVAPRKSVMMPTSDGLAKFHLARLKAKMIKMKINFPQIEQPTSRVIPPSNEGMKSAAYDRNLHWQQNQSKQSVPLTNLNTRMSDWLYRKRREESDKILKWSTATKSAPPAVSYY